MAKCTKAEAKRLLKSMRNKLSKLMVDDYITPKQYIDAYNCFEKMKKTMDK